MAYALDENAGISIALSYEILWWADRVGLVAYALMSGGSRTAPTLTITQRADFV